VTCFSCCRNVDSHPSDIIFIYPVLLCLISCYSYSVSFPADTKISFLYYSASLAHIINHYGSYMGCALCRLPPKHNCHWPSKEKECKETWACSDELICSIVNSHVDNASLIMSLNTSYTTIIANCRFDIIKRQDKIFCKTLYSFTYDISQLRQSNTTISSTCN